MKKHLIAAAVAAAVAAPAMAQNVTVYGILDTGVALTSNTNATGDSLTQVSSGLLNTSRLGVRGTEDLGGGMKARFTLEGGLGNDTGSMGAGFNAGTSATFDNTGSGKQKLFERQATVGLQINDTAIDIGRQNNLIASFGGAVDPLGYTFAGSNLNVNLLGLAGLSNIAGYSASSHAGSSFPGATMSPNLFRLDNSIRLSTTAGGVNVGLMHSMGENAAAGVANNPASSGATNAIGASGTFGGVTLSGAYQSMENLAGTRNLNGYILGAALPIGGFTLKMTTGQQKSDDDVVGKTQVWAFGLSTKVSAAGTLNVVYYNADNNSTDATRAGEMTKLGATYTHDLSKRTALYAAGFARNYDGGQSNFRGVGLKDSDTVFAAGVSHSF